MSFSFTLFDVGTASKDDWARYYAYYKKERAERDPQSSLLSFREFQNHIITRFSSHATRSQIYLISDTPQAPYFGILIYVTFSPKSKSYKANKHVAMFEFYLLRPYRAPSFENLVLQKLHDLAVNDDKTVFIAFSDNAYFSSCLERLQASLVAVSKEHRVMFPRINWVLLSQWVSHGEAIQEQEVYSLTIYDDLPESLYKPFSRLYSIIQNQQPKGDMALQNLVFTPEHIKQTKLQVNKVNGTWLILLLTNKNGDLIAFTEVKYYPDQPSFITQGLTGVLPEYRGHGLGKWIKARMLFEIKKRFPLVNTVRTTNMTTNIAMLTINKQIGFRPFKESRSYQFELSALRKYLAVESSLFSQAT